MTYDKSSLDSILNDVPGEPTDTYIFEELCKQYDRGYRDETRFLAGQFVLYAADKPKFIDSIVVANETESILIRIAVIIMLHVSIGKCSKPVLSKHHIHTALKVLSEKSHVKIITATYDKPNPITNVFTFENFQLINPTPPIGIIPNNHMLCYAASALTLLLSIDDVARWIYDAAITNGDRFLEYLSLYCWYLRTGAMPRAAIEHLNVETIINYLTEFTLGHAGDTLDVLTILNEYVPFTTHIYDFCSIESTAEPPEIITKISESDVSIREIKTSKETTISIHEEPSSLTYKEISPSHKTVYRVREDRSRREFGFNECVLGIIGDDRPYVLMMAHSISTEEHPSKFEIPCTIRLPDATYSIHGACLYDNTHSDGHYVTAIISNTTMFFYDSQYNRAFAEDLRIYRPRILCYIKVL